jgi:hypothetical protein
MEEWDVKSWDEEKYDAGKDEDGNLNLDDKLFKKSLYLNSRINSIFPLSLFTAIEGIFNPLNQFFLTQSSPYNFFFHHFLID